MGYTDRWTKTTSTLYCSSDLSRSAVTSNVPDQVFVSRRLHPDLDPSQFKNGVRECRVSTLSPQATPVIFAFDVTGSMKKIPLMIAQRGLVRLMEQVFGNPGIANPQIMFGAIGDGPADSAPLQFGQFETNLEVVDQIAKIYLEGGGGAWGRESYQLAWLTAVLHVQADAFEQGRRGVIFTTGDEGVHDKVTVREQVEIFGAGQYEEFTTKDVLEAAMQNWDVYHLHLTHDKRADSLLPDIKKSFTQAGLPEDKFLIVHDPEYLPEIASACIHLRSGAHLQDVLESQSSPAAKTALIQTFQG